MRKISFLIVYAMIGMFQLSAETIYDLVSRYTYFPFVREGVQWVYSCENPLANPGSDLLYFSFEMKGDTVINGKSYKPVHVHAVDDTTGDRDIIPVYLREQNHVVYGIIPDERSYWECPVGIGTWADATGVHSSIEPGVEFILYNFNEYSDVASLYENLDPEHFVPLHYAYRGPVQVGDYFSRRHVLYDMGSGGQQLGSEYIIDGLGYVDGTYQCGMPLNYFYPKTTSMSQFTYRLSHVIDDGKIVYRTSSCREPDDFFVYPYLSEGVKFVNEKVIVDHGDTTQYYYTYEMTYELSKSVNAGEWNDTTAVPMFLCHYYTGDSLDAENDSIISYVFFTLDRGANNFYTSDNKALRKLYDEGRAFVPDGGWSDFGYLTIGLYWGDYFDTAKFMYTQFYYNYNYPDIIRPTEDELVDADPIEVDGHEMKRIAYVDEDGHVLGYIVQGIGWDSWDRGDLLTPFTCAPDHDADHQEWCGLSHVVKDGEIIYKGMRYREGTHDGIDEVTADRAVRPADDNYYNLMGQPMGTEVPTVPGIYIHQGKKIVVR